MTQTVPQLSKLDSYLEGLTAVRQFLTEHPALPPVLSIFGDSVHLHLFPHDLPDDADIRGEFARHARTVMAGAPIGSVVKETTDSFMQISRKFGRVELVLQAAREVVCEKRVIGVEKVQVPDPDAPLVEVEREIVAWDCTPILADDRATAAAHYSALADEAKAEVSA